MFCLKIHCKKGKQLHYKARTPPPPPPTRAYTHPHTDARGSVEKVQCTLLLLIRGRAPQSGHESRLTIPHNKPKSAIHSATAFSKYFDNGLSRGDNAPQRLLGGFQKKNDGRDRAHNGTNLDSTERTRIVQTPVLGQARLETWSFPL